MANNTTQIDNKTKYSKRYIAIILTLSAFLLVWQGIFHYNTHNQNQQLLIQNSVSGTSTEITAAITSLQRSVSVFSIEHLPTIQHLATNPEDDKSLDILKAQASRHFPDHYAITIADDKGTPLLGNYNLTANELCQRAIKDFIINGYRYDVFIHPHPDAYHIDIMAPWPYPDKNSRHGIFFISIKPLFLSKILKNAQLLGHKLILVKNNIKGLIEVSSTGTRIDMPELSDNYFLTEKQTDLIRFSQPVKESNWDLVNIPDSNITMKLLKSISFQLISIFIIIQVISIVFLRTIKKEEVIRRNSEHNLNQAHTQLRQAIKFSGVATWRYNVLTHDIIWSDNTENIFNIKEPETLSEYLNIVDLKYQEKLSMLFYNCINSNSTQKLEYRTKEAGGLYSWHEITGKLQQNKEMCSTEILGLIRDISERKSVEIERIHFERHQKETLVREVHHRIKNSLQGVIGLLQQHIGNNIKYHHVLNHAISQLQSISVVHHIQSTTRDQKLYLNNLIKTICESAFQNMGINNPPLHINPSDNYFFIASNHNMVISLIINELVFNAIKHTSADKINNIKISLKQNLKNATFEVSNNGNPLPADFNFPKQKGVGTGLTLIKSLLPKKGAVITVEQAHDTVTFRLTLKAPILVNTHERSTSF